MTLTLTLSQFLQGLFTDNDLTHVQLLSYFLITYVRYALPYYFAVR